MSRPSARLHSPLSFDGAGVHTIRVILGEMPGMLREMIGAAIDEAPDMTVVATVDDRSMLASSIAQTEADVLVVSAPDGQGAEALQPLLYRQPRLTLLTIGNNGHSTALHELRPYTLTLGEVSPAELVDAIRASAHAHSP